MKQFLFIIILFIILPAQAQELPPIQKFTAADYGGDNQNWMISQAQNKFIYVANNKGLLEFNGSVWNSYPSPNNSVMRAVNVIDNKIYTGCYEEFGYWQKNTVDKLEYVSLSDKLKDEKLIDNQVWNILDYNEWVLFQTGRKLYFYNKEKESFKIMSSKGIIYKVFLVGEHIYYHVANEGIYKIINGEPKLINNDAVVLKDRVINIFEHDKQLLLLTRNSGFYFLEDNTLKSWDISAQEKLKTLTVFNSLQLEDSFLIGTISNGLFKIDKSGEIDYTINQKKGLGNNTVLTLFQDLDKNVWAGLDNGINCINLTSPIGTFIDYEGVLGTVYATVIFNNQLYVGTNQGLFYKSLLSKNQEFAFVEGTAGQVWSLYNDNNENLICGHHHGTFLIENSKAKNISKALGAWNFKKIPNQDNVLLQGNYSGLFLLEKSNGSWSLKHKVKGFTNSARFFEINSENQIFVNHEYKGLFSMEIDSNLETVSAIELHPEVPNSKSSSLISYRNNILYAAEQGIYSYKNKKKIFVKDTLMSNLLNPKEYISGKMDVDDTGKLWMFSKSNISFIKNNDLTNNPEITNIPIPSHLRLGVLGFENIQHLQDESYVLGTTNGYLTLNLDETYTEETYTINLNSISIKNLEEPITAISTNTDGVFDYNKSIFTFNYSVPQFEKYLDVKYQYRLIGHIDHWSNWTNKTTIQFENLPFGDYVFEVKAKIGNQLTQNTSRYNFTINRPWYFSNIALIFYVLAFFIIGFLIHKAYKFYYAKLLKHEQTNNEKTIIQIQNEKLNQDIESKNRELAISTMSIIKKNELLSKIKKELKNSSKKEDLGNAIELIDDNLNNNKDWKFFKQAFNNADKDFLDKIKAEHPELTPNDLRFCAYLRLNLSSKEIAPLLNISTKSVETKRYRLRKRLNLSHNDSLVKYILKF